MADTRPHTVDWPVGRSALACGVLGAIIGLVIGLVVHPPTAWAAALELGLPAAVIGVVLGLLVAAARGLDRRMRRRSF
jgi:hypothetical protein